MMTIKVKNKEYIVKFGYNSFCDSDLLDRTAEALGMVQEMSNLNQDDENKQLTTTETLAKVRKLFNLTRELLFEGFKKKNPVANMEEVGDILDDYLDEDTENNGLIDIFGRIAQELLKEGFFGNLLMESNKAIADLAKKKSARKKL